MAGTGGEADKSSDMRLGEESNRIGKARQGEGDKPKVKIDEKRTVNIDRAED